MSAFAAAGERGAANAKVMNQIDVRMTEFSSKCGLIRDGAALCFQLLMQKGRGKRLRNQPGIDAAQM
jgi:hypothetical protein